MRRFQLADSGNSSSGIKPFGGRPRFWRSARTRLVAGPPSRLEREDSDENDRCKKHERVPARQEDPVFGCHECPILSRSTPRAGRCRRDRVPRNYRSGGSAVGRQPAINAVPTARMAHSSAEVPKPSQYPSGKSSLTGREAGASTSSRGMQKLDIKLASVLEAHKATTGIRRCAPVASVGI